MFAAVFSRAFWVLAISGLLGFRVGIIGFPTWQIAVESAQVVAGLVPYPPDNPFYLYHTKLWSLVIQACALLLRAGVSEITLSLVLSGVLGMVSFQALSMVVFALSRSVPLSIGTAFVVFVSRITDHGVVYPIFLLGTHHTYGALGLSYFVLTIALLASGCRRTGAFLLGMGPAVHASVGTWVGLAAVLAFVWDHQRLREEFRDAWPALLEGAAVTVVSLAVQFAFVYHRGEADAAEVARAFSTFVSVWDDHRRAGADMAHTGVVLNRMALAVGLIWLLGFARDLSASAVFLLRVVVITAAISLGFVLLSGIPPERIPMTLSILMPGRLLNFDVMVGVPLLVGLLGLYRQRLSAQLLILVLLGGLVFSRSSLFWLWAAERQWQWWTMRFDPLFVAEICAVGLVCVAVSNSDAYRVRRAPDWIASVAAGVCAFLVVMIAFATTWRITGSRDNFRDRTNDPFFREVAGDHRGLTVSAGTFQLIQLYTRRPVLIDSGALDTMVYAPASAPAMVRILRDVYGIDFFNPPPEVRSASAVPHALNRAYWAQLTSERWQELRKIYNITQIVTRSDYELNLPVAAQTENLKLYRIP